VKNWKFPLGLLLTITSMAIIKAIYGDAVLDAFMKLAGLTALWIVLLGSLESDTIK
jgi:hypothetical protein